MTGPRKTLFKPGAWARHATPALVERLTAYQKRRVLKLDGMPGVQSTDQLLIDTAWLERRCAELARDLVRADRDTIRLISQRGRARALAGLGWLAALVLGAMHVAGLL